MGAQRPSAPLAGVGVLVTRPAHQAEHLAGLIEAAGGTAWRLPALSIVAPGDEGSLQRALERLEEYDLAIFVSANAVAWGLDWLLARRDRWPARLPVAAIGRATARALRKRGFEAPLCPAGGFDSEALLAEPALGPSRVRGRRILIVRGEGGREQLAKTLRARGAEVDYAEAYRRQRAEPPDAELIRRWAEGEIDIVTVTSAETMEALDTLVDETTRGYLHATPLVVVSERMLKKARELGFRAPILVSEPGDEAMVATLRAWRDGQTSHPAV